MSDTGKSGSDEAVPRSRTTTYVAVVAVEALVVLALWWFGRYFSS